MTHEYLPTYSTYSAVCTYTHGNYYYAYYWDVDNVIGSTYYINNIVVNREFIRNMTELSINTHSISVYFSVYCNQYTMARFFFLFKYYFFMIYEAKYFIISAY